VLVLDSFFSLYADRFAFIPPGNAAACKWSRRL